MFNVILMKHVWRVSLYQSLAAIGIAFVLFIPVPLSLATLSSLEPLLLLSLLAVWSFSYYLRTTLAMRAGEVEATPAPRRLLPRHMRTADLARILILGLGLLIVWIVWSDQPFRIFNATILGVAWAGVEIINTLIRFRQPHARGIEPPPLARINEKAQ